MPDKLIPGWFTQKENTRVKIFQCPKCKMTWATKGNSVTCDNCKRTYDLHAGNRAKVIMED